MENVTRRIFTLVVMLPNFIHFRPKIDFKRTFKTFTSHRHASEVGFGRKRIKFVDMLLFKAVLKFKRSTL